MFHGVSRKKRHKIPSNVQPHLELIEFESIIEWLKINFDFLTIDDLINHGKSGVLLTFDDGFNNNYTNVVPILKKNNIPAIFFTATQHIVSKNNWLHFVRNNVDSYWSTQKNIPSDIGSDWYDGMSEDSIREIAKDPLFTIGSHTITHPLLTKCSKKELKKELIESKEYLEKLTQKPINYFAYPSGDYNENIMKQVQNAGYDAAFGIDEILKVGNLRYEIPRIGIYSSEIPYLSAKLSGLYLRTLKKIDPIIEQ